jgi:PAS domain S-box-containing protein
MQRGQAAAQALTLFPRTARWGISEIDHPELMPVGEDAETLREQFITLMESEKKRLIQPVFHPDPPSTRLLIMDMVASSTSVCNRVVAIEKQVQASQPAEIARIRSSIMPWLIAGVLASCVISLGLVWLFTADVIKRLKAISRNATLISTGKPLPPEQKGSDEIAALDRVLHQTSARMQEWRVQEFAILDNAAAIVGSLDSRLRFTAVNPAAARIWHYQPDELRGMSVLHLVSESTADATRSGFKRAAETEQETEFENVIRSQGGQAKESRWKVRWSRADGKYYCVVHDVTQLRAIERLKQEFLAIVSHDLRSPLSSVAVSLSLLTEGKRGEVPEPVEKMLRIAQASAQQLTQLVNELLELEKLESRVSNLELTAVSASDACALAKESLLSLAGKAQVRLRGPVGDALLQADPRRLVQVLINLLSNAIKFSPAGGTVTISLVPHEQGWVEIRVADEGPGIPPEHQTLIFDKFQQSRAVSNVAIKGTGLGLAIVKAIVEAHQGSVGVESDGKSGSTFWVRMPRFAGEEDL